MPERIPEGYHILSQTAWGDFLSKDDKTEHFLLTDRHFKNINHYLGYLPSQIIEYLLKKFPEREVRILDLGAGKEVLAARELIEKYPRLRVYTADLVVNPKLTSNGVDVTQSDGSRLVFADNVFDFVYSYEALRNIRDEEKHVTIVRELIRVLKPGNAAILDETLPIDKLKERIDDATALFLYRRGNINEPGTIVLGSPTCTTMILKDPIDHDLLTIKERIVGHM